MAAYNAEKFIDEAISSIIKQTFTDWQLIVVDDGSADSTPSILQRYAASDERISIINQTNSGSAGAARNSALKFVQGKYCQMLDSDDIISENFLELHYDLLVKDNPDIIIPNLIFFENGIKNEIRKWIGLNGKHEVINGEAGFFLSLDWTIHGFFTVRTEILKEVKYENDLINGDEFTTRKLLYNSKKIMFSDSFYYYRLNTSSTTRDEKNQVKMYQCLLTDYNLLEYSIYNNMSIEIKKACAKKLLNAIKYYYKSYNDEHKKWSREDSIYVHNILSSVYSKINIMKMLKLIPVFSLFLCLTGKKYVFFEFYMFLKAQLIRYQRLLNIKKAVTGS